MHDMKLHQVKAITKKIRVIRVPGGWIYERIIKKLSEEDFEVIAIFVPYSDEFNEQIQTGSN